IDELWRACRSVPDVSDYWLALAGQLRRNGQTDPASEAALNAYRATWAFGRPSEAVLRMLRGATQSSEFRSDPIVRRSSVLSGKFGGERENSTYALLKECIDEYFASQRPLHALQLLQNYAYMMCMETKPFQERNGFSLPQWQAELSDLCQKHLGDSRTAIT